MTKQMGKIGEIRAKMAELRMISDKEKEIQRHKIETAKILSKKSLQSIESTVQETVSNIDKIGKLKAQLRSVEADLVKALSVKTRKEANKMAISESISATKAKIEVHKNFVADQRARKDEYAEIISYQAEVLKEYEEKHKQDAECREEIEEAISWYNTVLGFRIERGHGIKFIFSKINLKNPNEEFFFTIRLENDKYSLLDCHPYVSDANRLIQELNFTHGLYNFVRTMRKKFQEIAAGSLPESAFHLEESTIISMSAPNSSISTDSGSGSLAKRQHKKVSRKPKELHRVQSSVLSPGSASSLRRSPRFKVKK